MANLAMHILCFTELKDLFEPKAVFNKNFTPDSVLISKD